MQHSTRHEPVRPGWRRLTWQGSYRPRLGFCQGTTQSGHQTLGLTEVRLSTTGKLPTILDQELTRASQQNRILLVSSSRSWWEMDTSKRWAWLRNLGKRLVAHPNAILDLPLPVPTPEKLADAELLCERAIDEARVLAPNLMVAARFFRTRGHHTGNNLNLTRLAQLPLVPYKSGNAHALTLPLLAMAHDRPCMAIISPGKNSLVQALLWSLGCSLAGVLLQTKPTANLKKKVQRINGFLAEHSDLSGGDPAQEPVAILLTDPSLTRSILQPVEMGLHAMGRLGINAKVATAWEPLSLDKQKLILVPSPGEMTGGTIALLLRKATNGALVAITGPVNIKKLRTEELPPPVVELLMAKKSAPSDLDWGRGKIRRWSQPVERKGLGPTIAHYEQLFTSHAPTLKLQEPRADLLVRPWLTAAGWGLSLWAPPGSRAKLLLPTGGEITLTRGGGHLMVGDEKGLVAHLIA